MIYFKNEIMKFPKHFDEKPEKLVLTNEMTGEVFEFGVEDLSKDIRYYEFDLTDLELKNGTYTYYHGTDCGLLQVGEYDSVATSYDEKKTNVVYER